MMYDDRVEYSHMHLHIMIYTLRPRPLGDDYILYYCTVEPGYSEVHKSDRSFHYSYYFTIARVKYMCVVGTVRLVASV